MVGTTLTQTVSVTPSTTYNLGFFSVRSNGNVGRSFTVTVNGNAVTLINSNHIGWGTHPVDFMRTGGTYTTGPAETSATVIFNLFGSGSGLRLLSYDNFFFQTEPAPGAAVPTGFFPTTLSNPGFETGNLSGWMVGGNADDGVAMDGVSVTGGTNQVRSGTYSAWNRTAQGNGIGTTLTQILSVVPGASYDLGFHEVVSSGNFGISGMDVVVNGVKLSDSTSGGSGSGTDPSDFRKIAASYTTGSNEDVMVLRFNLYGSGSGLANFSYDDFFGPEPFLCNGVPATMVGTNGPDVLMGTPGPDVIVGLGGADEIFGLGGDDTICGGPGKDLIDGNDGDDWVSGGSGKDIIRGGWGRDKLMGNNGADLVLGGLGDDVIRGGNGNGKLAGSKGDDLIRGGKGDDTLLGNDGDDILFGNKGDDMMFCGDDPDIADGGPHIVQDTADPDCEFVLNVP